MSGPARRSPVIRSEAERSLAREASTMASIEKRNRNGRSRWYVRYVDPRRAAVTVGEFAKKWKAAQAHLKPSTRERYAGLLREHVEPRWGRVPLSDVAHSDVQAWVSDLAEKRSASAAIKAHRVLSLVLSLAVRDGRLARNP